ncbi:hypothetical protein ACIGB8_28775 [Promicromonospora sukumoe]|uniref:hypothetical protein n=1 Tax=Promicromonospora sukumoe TaxID=88382 RepID=UPI0037C6B01C
MNDYLTPEARAQFARAITEPVFSGSTAAARRRADIDAELIAAALERADWDKQTGWTDEDEPADRLSRAAHAYRIEHAGEGI